MGWIFDVGVHGQGIASEACSAALDWLDAKLPPTPVWAIIAPDNQPSRRLAQKLGFEELDETSYKDERTLVLRRPPRG